MFKAIRTVLFLIGLLTHAVVHADSTTSGDRSPLLSTTLSDSIPLPAYDSPPPARSFSSSFDKLHFQDSSAVGRASKLRSLSLLTLAEFRKSRVFLGVNNRGVLGLHFNMTRQGDERCLEVARMPYLRDKTPD